MGIAMRAYTCDMCGVRTVDPFVLQQRVLCAVCADHAAPEVVSARERFNRRRFSDSKVPTSRFRD
jgi:uncharacterized Zn finger protein (UPF0148 family)